MEERKINVNQELKRNRTKMYFLEAARAMITKDGVESVSVRKVADVAGYSYPTLYNYYKDINELLWDVRLFMIQEVISAIREKSLSPTKNAQGIKDLFKAYIDYYLTNPNIFKFFYFHQLQRPDREKDTIDEPDFGAMWHETFKAFVLEGKLNEADIEVFAKTLIYAIHGILTLSFSNNGDFSDKTNIYNDLDKIVNYLMK